MSNNPVKFPKARFFLILLPALFLLFFNLSIAGQEKLRNTGAVMILKLAPVDPRSLMQGDYMALDFQEARHMYRAVSDLPGSDFLAVMAQGENGVCHFVRLHNSWTLGPNERLLRFKLSGRRAVIGGGSFFFEEGGGQTYARAKYAKLRVAEDGTAGISELLYEDFTPVRVKREE